MAKAKRGRKEPRGLAAMDGFEAGRELQKAALKYAKDVNYASTEIAKIQADIALEGAANRFAAYWLINLGKE